MQPATAADATFIIEAIKLVLIAEFALSVLLGSLVVAALVQADHARKEAEACRKILQALAESNNIKIAF